MHPPEFLVFANDAQLAAIWAGMFLALAAVARVAEARRVRRARIDHVGWVPWTGLFLVCSVIGITLLALAAKGLLAPGA
ncbi:hypothetical protein GCM10011515_04330 [Tsuneonella deserti]|uniref:Uncharacterized protein n=1 Tax=Tsuneonella deserti TaxID=2035528 RepID=A0ABQ1S1P1_9SPHN|nr:hypothetical protein [Tsuneonella deserti]GGD87830.1 hypothetical protein GCM10011515_04330 [Tsuneonella deserti]